MHINIDSNYEDDDIQTLLLKCIFVLRHSQKNRALHSGPVDNEQLYPSHFPEYFRFLFRMCPGAVSVTDTDEETGETGENIYEYVLSYYEDRKDDDDNIFTKLKLFDIHLARRSTIVMDARVIYRLITRGYIDESIINISSRLWGHVIGHPSCTREVLGPVLCFYICTKPVHNKKHLASKLNCLSCHIAQLLGTRSCAYDRFQR
eukprot:gene5282-10570_t